MLIRSGCSSIVDIGWNVIAAGGGSAGRRVGWGNKLVYGFGSLSDRQPGKFRWAAFGGEQIPGEDRSVLGPTSFGSRQLW